MHPRSALPVRSGSMLPILFLTPCIFLANAAFLEAQSPPPTTCGNTGAVCILTGQHDNSRSSFNPYESTLSPTYVSSMSTSSAFTLQVDTAVPSGSYSNPVVAQPLYVAGVSPVGGDRGTHNLLIVATLNGTIFAFDADGKTCDALATSSTCWSRQGATALPYTDCGGQAGDGPAGGVPNLPFAGVVSTPVIDPTLSTPTIFLTSLCQNTIPTYKWYLHALNLLTGMDNSNSPVLIGATSAATNSADGLPQGTASGTISFLARDQFQRAALLEVPPPYSGSSLTPMLYMPFGVLNANENDNIDFPYHGWLLGYSTAFTGTSTPSPSFASTTAGCGTGGGWNRYGMPQTQPQCSLFGSASGGSPGCDCKVETGFASTPNWGGHGGGAWMHSRGPAAVPLADGSYHVLFGVGNGGFQQFNSTQTGPGPNPSINNWGQSILDFRYNSNGPDATPFQSFTPLSAAVAPNLSSFQSCAGPSGPVACAATFEQMNGGDYDMGASGVLLFQDPRSSFWLVTIDKAGYGYVLQPGSFCGPGVSNCDLVDPGTHVQGYAANDPGNQFPFAPVLIAGKTTVCGAAQPDMCNRVTSLAFNSLSSPNYLYFWPYGSRLTALAVSDNSTLTQGVGNISVSGTAVQLIGGCTFGSIASPCFGNQIVAGDRITVQYTGTTSETRTVMNIVDNTDLTVNTAFTGTPPSNPNWYYAGFFINPTQDSSPPATGVGFAGGALAVSSAGATGGVLWAVLAQPAQGGGTDTRTAGALYGYNATPTAGSPWAPIFTSTSAGSDPNGFCANAYSLPTVAKGRVYVPTYAIGGANYTCPPSGGSPPSAALASGIAVYGAPTP